MLCAADLVAQSLLFTLLAPIFEGSLEGTLGFAFVAAAF